MGRFISLKAAAVLLGAQCAMGLTSGPAQPEYIGFKSAAQKDMVDLKSGDFGYSIPVMELPGPSFSYPLTLGYHSGIQLDQEASWVGLGWSLNPGAINRGLNRYPDDYLRGYQKSTFKGREDYEGGSINLLVASANWNESGEISGHIGLKGFFSISGSYAPWEGYTASGGMFGFEYGFNNRSGFGFQETPTFMQALASMVSVGGMQSGTEGWNPLDKEYPFEPNMVAGAMTVGVSLQTMYEYGTNYDFSLSNFWSRSVTTGAIKREVTKDYFVYSENRTSIDKTEETQLYGYLNLGDYPREDPEELAGICTHYLFSGGPVAKCKDMIGGNWQTKGHRMEFDWAAEEDVKADNIDAPGIPPTIAAMLANFGRKNSWAVSTQDGFTVKAEGVGFGFRSYRQDLGDYYAESGVTAHRQGAVKSILIQATGQRQKSQRRHKYDMALGEYASRFYSESETDVGQYFGNYPVSVFREAGDMGGTFESEDWPDRCYELGQSMPSDCRGFLAEHRYLFREHLEYQGDSRYGEFVRPPKVQQFPDRVSGSKGVFPKFKRAYNEDGIDPAEGVCEGVRDPDIPECDPLVPEKALIGFTFVRPDGMIYEYHKPAFNWIQKSASVDRPTEQDREDQWGHYDYGSVKGTSTLERPYAYSWLLTAVKTPDYVDRNDNGISDKGDIGGWVRFEYGTTLKNYHWRSPYEGTKPLGTGEDIRVFGDKDDTIPPAGFEDVIVDHSSYGTASWGVKEIHYLSGIYSETHQIKTVLSDRKDGLQARAEESNEGFTLVDATHFKSPYIRPKYDDRLEFRKGQETAVVRVTVVEDPNPITWPCDESAELDYHACNGVGADILTTFVVESGTISSFIGEDFTVKMLVSDTRMKKLDRLQLYEHNSDNGVIDSDEPMLREVKLEYGYDLAPGIPNHEDMASTTLPNGKLTLRKVSIGDGQTFFPPYEFSYAMEGSEAPYQMNHWDRWGYYKRNGGLEKSAFDWDDVIDWAGLHAEIKKTAPANFLTGMFRTSLGANLGPIESAATLTDAMKEHILAAMTKTAGNLNFYAQNRTAIGLPASLTGRAEVLFDLLVERGIFNPNGDLKSGPLTEEEKNKVEWFHNSIVDREYGKGPAGDPGFDLLRKVNKNRFDHEPNKDDVMAWSLRNIRMPSGGVIEVEYESDDYAYESRAKVVRVEKRKVDTEAGETKFFRSIGMEKSLSSVSNLLEISEEQFGENFKERAEDIEVRVESVFRLYRQVANASGLEIQMNEDFRRLHDRHYNPKTIPDTDPKSTANPYRDENDLHLIAWFIPPSRSFYASRKSSDPYPSSSCGTLPIWNSSRLPMPIPIDLGPVQQAFEYHGSDADIIPGDWPESKFCQRNWVTFKLSQLLSPNFQGNSGSNTCPPNFLGERFYLTWSRKRDIFLIPENTDPENHEHEWRLKFRNPGGSLDILDARSSEWAYIDPTRAWAEYKPRLGNWAWYDLDEYSAYRQDQPQNPPYAGDFKKGYWDFYNVNTYLAAPANFVGEAAGLIGGGIRTKRVIMHSGWAQKPGAPAQLQVVEYAYDGAGGFGGTYTSGSTPSIPPPYNNKGDDRRPKSPSSEMLQKSPGVTYRTVATIRPGMGRTVHHFLTSADVGDFWTLLPCNIEEGGCNGLEDVVGGFQRWRLNRVAHFQGTPIGSEVYNEKGKLLSKVELKYLVSMNQVRLGELNELSVVNNSDAVGGALALVPSETVSDQTGETHTGVPLNAGSGQFGRHAASDRMGKTVSRYRHRYNWHFELGCEEADDIMSCLMSDDGSGLDHPLATMAVTEVEEVENSIHPYSTVAMTDGTATEENISFFDFFTGTPLVSTKHPLGQGPKEERKQRPDRTDVKVPAYWLPEYNPAEASLPSMGSVYRDPNFRAVANGTAPVSTLKHKNMLSQEFSQSVYSDLAGFTFSEDEEAPWRDNLDDKKLYRRKLTPWQLYGDNGEKIWRIAGDISFRMDMGEDKLLVGDELADIRMPYPPPGETVASYYSNPFFYPRTLRHTQIDAFGKVLEIEDLNGNSSAFFYDRDIYLVGQVANARRKDVRILTIDEIRSLTSLPDGWTSTGSISFHTEARSGTKSLEVSSGGSLNLTLAGATEGNYQLSFWIKRGSGGANVNLGGSSTTAAPVSKGKQWQRITRSVAVSAGGSPSLSIAAAGAGSVYIDDIRLAPVEAQVYAMTYDGQGRISSQSGPNDIISYFNHDAYGRLVEVRDHEGLLISTQAQREARK